MSEFEKRRIRYVAAGTAAAIGLAACTSSSSQSASPVEACPSGQVNTITTFSFSELIANGTHLDVPTLLRAKGTATQQGTEWNTVVTDVDKTLKDYHLPTDLTYDIRASVEFDASGSVDSAKAQGKTLAQEALAAIQGDRSDQPSYKYTFDYDTNLGDYSAVSGSPEVGILQFVPTVDECVPSPSSSGSAG
jgi:hypothetical protein